MQYHKTKYLQSLFFIFFLVCSSLVINAQAKIPAKPKFQKSVYDDAKLLSGHEKRALERNKNKRKLAAKELGISERTLYRKIKQFDL